MTFKQLAQSVICSGYYVGSVYLKETVGGLLTRVINDFVCKMHMEKSVTQMESSVRDAIHCWQVMMLLIVNILVLQNRLCISFHVDRNSNS